MQSPKKAAALGGEPRAAGGDLAGAATSLNLASDDITTRFTGQVPNFSASQSDTQVDLVLSLPIERAGPLQARLTLLAARTGLSPGQVVEALITGADPQLVRTCARVTPGIVGSGWRARRGFPLQFIVADSSQEGNND